MGIIYNNNVEESKIYQAYGLTVYGKVNRYEWTIYNESENALISIRIADRNGNDIFSMYMGNNCILQKQIDDTLDNFLWWIAEDRPDSYLIEKQIYKSLCASDCLFNHSIIQRKNKAREEAEERKCIAEREAAENADKERIKVYCMESNLLSYFVYDHVYIIKPHNEKAKSLLELANNKKMQALIDFMKQYPQNKDAYIVKDGTMEEILKYIV